MDSCHLTAYISLDIQDIKTYDTPKNSWFPVLHIDIMYLDIMEELWKKNQKLKNENSEIPFLIFEQWFLI